MIPTHPAPGVTLYHGDCLDVLPTLAAGSVDAIVTDPPFGARRPSARRSAGDRFDEVYGNDSVRADWLASVYLAIRAGGAAYVFVCWDRMEAWRAAMAAVGFRVRSCIVWDKGVHGLADPDTCWAPRHEMILFGAKGRHGFVGDRPVDVLSVPRVPAGRLLHPYQKPVPLIVAIIKASVPVGGVVLDPFVGSGTTLVACQKSGRRAIGIEVAARYIPVIERRCRDASAPLLDLAESASSPRLFD